MNVARTGWLGYSWSMETSSNWFMWALLSAVFAALTAIFAKLGLLLVVLFAVVFLKERPDPREWTGIALVAAGDGAGFQTVKRPTILKGLCHSAQRWRGATTLGEPAKWETTLKKL